jgi:hypothetical protein
MYRLGVHTFYRPRAWTDVPEGPVWASVPVPAKSPSTESPSTDNPDAKEPVSATEPTVPEKSPEAAIKAPQASAAPEPEATGASAPL